jgi:hypothetical protein
MAEFLRPAARALLWRWREVLAGAGLALFGLWLALGGFGLARILGWGALATGLALIWTGWQRLRFARGGGGAGVVQIAERRIAYFGPLKGGVLDLDDLRRLEIDPTGHPLHWILTGPGGEILTIPVDAEGADRLFDLFAALPGLRSARLLAALEQPPEGRITLWAAVDPDRPRLR